MAAADAFAAKMASVIKGYIAQGLSQREIVVALNALGIKAVQGGNWSLIQVQRVMKRIAYHPAQALSPAS